MKTWFQSFAAFSKCDVCRYDEVVRAMTGEAPEDATAQASSSGRFLGGGEGRGWDAGDLVWVGLVLFTTRLLHIHNTFD